MQTVSIEQIKQNLKSGGFFLNCKIPMGYTAGFPILQIKNECLCVMFPFLRYQTTGVVDKTLVFPIRYLISMELPTEKIIGFEDCEYRADFQKIEFDKPVGYFRHDAVKQYNRKQYDAIYLELMDSYDKVANALLGNGTYTYAEEQRMTELLQIMVEPSLLPMYKAIDGDFYHKYFK